MKHVLFGIRVQCCPGRRLRPHVATAEVSVGKFCPVVRSVIEYRWRHSVVTPSASRAAFTARSIPSPPFEWMEFSRNSIAHGCQSCCGLFGTSSTPGPPLKAIKFPLGRSLPPDDVVEGIDKGALDRFPTSVEYRPRCCRSPLVPLGICSDLVAANAMPSAAVDRNADCISRNDVARCG